MRLDRIPQEKIYIRNYDSIGALSYLLTGRTFTGGRRGYSHGGLLLAPEGVKSSATQKMLQVNLKWK